MLIKDVAALLGPNLEWSKRTSIQTHNGAFLRISPSLRAQNDEGVIDGRRLLMIPGLINCHTHVGDSIAKDLGVGSDLEGRIHPVWGIKSKVLKSTSVEHLVQFMRMSCISMIRHGITTFADFREGGMRGIEMLKEACRGVGIRPVILGRPSLYQSEEEIKSGASLSGEIAAEIAAITDACDGIGISGANENSDAALYSYSRISKIRAIHAAESAQTETTSRSMTGKGEVWRAMRMNPTMLVHMTHATIPELEVAAQTSGVVACPRSNALLSGRLPDIPQMLKSGCVVGLGTDNVMLNPPDMFGEMEFAWKGTGLGRLNPQQVLQMATVNGGRILNKDVGVISPGAKADYILIDRDHIDISMMHDAYAALVHRASAESIRAVAVNGDIVYEQS